MSLYWRRGQGNHKSRLLKSPAPLTPRRLRFLILRTIRDGRSARPVKGRSHGGVLSGARRSLARPVFIIGAPRSGTTILGQCLAVAPHITYHFEPVLTKSLARFVYERPRAHPLARIGFRLGYLILILTSRSWGLRLTEKTPQNCFIIDFLARTFPGAQFVHIIRDGRASAVSYAEKPWLAAASAGSGRREPGGYAYGPYPRFWVEPERASEFASTTDLHRCIWAWRRHVEAARNSAARLPPARYLEIRYEDLVRHPDETLTLVLDFLGTPPHAYDPVMGMTEEVTDTSLQRWRSVVDDHGLTTFHREAGLLLNELGYA